MAEILEADLIRKYQHLCYELGLDDEADDIPESREDLINKIQELNFQIIHDRYLS